MDPRPDPPSRDEETFEGFGPEALHQARAALSEELAAASAPFESGDLIGRYRVVRPLGAGGFGAVYEAEQLRPVRRRVAIKVAGAGTMSAAAAQRLMDEQQTLAAIHDPAIIALLDTGVIPPEVVGGAGRPYLVMQLVEGLPITRFADERGLGLRERIELLAEAARGVASAHRHGVIHRDLKPAHMVVEESGQVRLIDFGVAKTEHPDRLSATLTGQMIGTPRYMSPEQRAGRVGEIDTRSDVYALGMVLAELVIGGSMADHDPVTVARMPTSQLLPSERSRWARHCRRDVDWIVRKALADQPEDRYDSAEALRQDLLRAARGEVVSARPRSAWLPVLSLARRRPATTAAIAVLAVVLPTGVPVLTVLWLRNAQLARDAVEEAAAAKREAYVAQLTGAHAALTVGAVGPAREQLFAADPLQRDWCWRHLASRAAPGGEGLLRVPRSEGRQDGKLEALALTSDGSVLVVGDAAGTVWSFATADAAQVGRGRVPDQVYCAVADPGSPSAVLIGCADGGLYRWQTDAASDPQLVSRLGQTPIALAVQPGRGVLAVGCVETREMLVIDPRNGTVLERLATSGGNTFATAFTPDGEYLLAGTDAGTIETWRVTSGERVASVHLDAGRVQSLAVSADGRQVLSAGMSGRLTLSALDTSGTIVPIAEVQEASGLMSCTFGPDGRSVWVVGVDGTLRRRHADSLQLEAEWFQHDQPTYGLVAHPESGVLYTCAFDGILRALDPPSNPGAFERRVLGDEQVLWDEAVQRVLRLHAGRFEVVDATTGTVVVVQYPATQLQGSQRLDAEGGLSFYDAAAGQIRRFAPDGRSVAVLDVDFSAVGGPPQSPALGVRSPELLWGDDKESTLIAWPDRLLTVDMLTGAAAMHPGSGTVTGNECDCFALDDGRILVSRPDDTMLVRRDGSVQDMTALHRPGKLWWFRQQGSYLLMNWGEARRLAIYDLQTERMVLDLDNQSRIGPSIAAITPDGRTLAVAKPGGSVDLYQVQTGRRLLTLPGTEPASALDFDAGGSLRLGTQRGTLKLWRAGGPNTDWE